MPQALSKRQIVSLILKELIVDIGKMAQALSKRQIVALILKVGDLQFFLKT